MEEEGSTGGSEQKSAIGDECFSALPGRGALLNGKPLSGEPVLEVALRARSAVAALDPVLFREWTGWLGIDTFRLRRPGRDPSS